MCKPDWAEGCTGSWANTVARCAWEVLLEETDFGLSGLSEGDSPPRCGRAWSEGLRAQAGGGRAGYFLSEPRHPSPLRSDAAFPAPGLNRDLNHQSPWFSGLQTKAELHHRLSGSLLTGRLWDLSASILTPANPQSQSRLLFVSLSLSFTLALSLPYQFSFPGEA